MLSFLWVFMILAAIGCSLFAGTTSALSGAAMEGAASAIQIALTLAGPMCLWCGVGELMRRCGLREKLAQVLRPVLGRLFPKLRQQRDGFSALGANVTANLLGLGNAATPMGIEACKAMNDGTGTATDEQCRLVVMNTASHSAAAHHGGRSAGEPGVQNASGHFAGGMAHIRMLGGHGAGAVQALTETEGRPVITDLLIPALLALTACVALWRRENVYDAMTCGAAEGLRLLVNIVPALVVLLTAVHMLRASGALDKLGELLSPYSGPWASRRSCCR